MSSPRGPDPVTGASTAAWAAIGFAASLLLRLPAFSYLGFVSHDVAGILYEGGVLRRGGLPYVDTVELKAPLSFYVAALVAPPGEKGIATFQIAAVLWSSLATALFAAYARRRLRPGRATKALVAFVLGAPVLDSMDANYVTWALPFALAAVAAAESGARHGRPGRFAAAGACWALATLTRRQCALLLLPLIVALAAVPRPRMKSVLAMAAGAAAAVLPIALHYASSGRLAPLLEGMLWNPWGRAYVTAVPFDLREAVRATAFFLAWPLSVALLGHRPDPAGSPSFHAFHRVVVAHLAATVAGAWIGGRFYKGYFLLAWPAACLVAAARWPGRSTAGTPAARIARGSALAAALLLGARQAAWWVQTTRERLVPRDRVQRHLAQRVQTHTPPGSPIWCWGWHLWDIYPLTGRPSASRIYKGLGLLTPPNDDTWRRPPSRLVFRPGPAAELLLRDFDRSPPAAILLGSTVPHRSFHGLRRRLAASYRRDPTVRAGRLEVWIRTPPAR